MAELPPTSYIALNVPLQDVLSAHDKLREGIATHAEKEKARRQQARRELAAQRRLEGK
jgi:hypothetical protein